MVSGQHAHNDVRVAVKQQFPAEDVGIFGQPPLPEAIGQHDGGGVARLNAAAECDRNSHHAEEIVRNPNGEQSGGGAANTPVDLGLLILTSKPGKDVRIPDKAIFRQRGGAASADPDLRERARIATGWLAE
jgi:hypothetical protein